MSNPKDKLSAEQIAALETFKKENGRYWKHALWLLWTNGKDEGALRQVRNIIGPTGLQNIKL